jgi:hypothetical protein
MNKLRLSAKTELRVMAQMVAQEIEIMKLEKEVEALRKIAYPPQPKRGQEIRKSLHGSVSIHAGK